MNLVDSLWIPTNTGLHSLQEVLTSPVLSSLRLGHPLEEAALLRLLALLITRSHGNVELYLETHARRFELHSDEPFMQIPHRYTERLPPAPIHALTLRHATGRDITFLGGSRDDRPEPLSPAEAARQLLTYQAFALSRGVTRFQHSRDAPLARTLTFYAEGETLRETLALNAPTRAVTPPTWEQAPKWADWVEGVPCRLDETTVQAWPWRSVTLVPRQGGLTHVKLASGPVPELDTTRPSPDEHTLQEAVPEEDWDRRGRRYDQSRNPQTREGAGALVSALHAALSGSLLAPLSFRRALASGAVRVTVTGLSSRSGQPVIFDTVHASLPWPTVPLSDAVSLLDMTRQAEERLLRAARAALGQAGQGTIAAVQASPTLKVYWQGVWPVLSAALVGSADGADLEAATRVSAAAGLHAALQLNHPGWALGRHVLSHPSGL